MRKKSRFSKKEGQVFQVDKIELLRTSYLNPDYEFVPCRCPVRPRSNDHFLLFSFVPKRPGLPRFEGRLDESRRQGRKVEVDIDLRDASGQAVKAFRDQKAPYRGHHTCQVGANAWNFSVHLQLPADHFCGLQDGRIFDGVICLSQLVRAIETKAESKAEASVEAKVIRGSGEGRTT